MVPTCRLFFLAATAAMVSAATAPGQPAPDPAAFKVTVAAKLTMSDGGPRQMKLDAGTTIQYTWKPDGKVRTLVLDSMDILVATDGKQTMNARMSRDGFADVATKKEVKSADAPAGLKALLTDTFGSPICKIEVDGAGKEVKRTLVAGPGAASLDVNGMVVNCLMFHPPYSADKNEWQADLEVTSGSGIASGKATYTKTPGGKGGQAVKVSGTLTADGVKDKSGLVVKGGKYTVAGEQTYDPERKEWVAGKFSMDIAFQLTDGTKVVATGKGEVVVTFEILPAKK